MQVVNTLSGNPLTILFIVRFGYANNLDGKLLSSDRYTNKQVNCNKHEILVPVTYNDLTTYENTVPLRSVDSFGFL